MAKKFFIPFTLFLAVVILAACANKYRVEREGMPEELKARLEQQVQTGKEMLAAATDEDAKLTALLEIAFGNDQLGRFDLAIPFYEEMLEISANDFRALNNLAVIYEEVGEHRKAAEYYGKLLDANPSDKAVLEDAIRALLSLGDYTGAEKTLEKFTIYNKGDDPEMQTFISNQFTKIQAARVKATSP